MDKINNLVKQALQAIIDSNGENTAECSFTLRGIPIKITVEVDTELLEQLHAKAH